MQNTTMRFFFPSITGFGRSSEQEQESLHHSRTSDQTERQKMTKARSTTSRVLYALSVPGLLLGLITSYWIRKEWYAIESGRKPPSWFTFNTGSTVINTFNWMKKAIVPLDVQAVEMTLGFMDHAVVFHLAFTSALDTFTSTHECLKCEEIALAARQAPHVPYLCRLLDAASDLNILDYHHDQDCYSITKLGKRFQIDGPFYEMAIWHGLWIGAYYEGLAAGLQSGNVPFQELTDKEFWTYLRENQSQRALFDGYMTKLSTRIGPSLAEAVEEALEEVEVDDGFQKSKEAVSSSSSRQIFCDIGGGGNDAPLLSYILLRYPFAKGLIFDLPEANEIYADSDLDESQVSMLEEARRRLKHISGSFLVPGEMKQKLGPHKCTTMVMKHILHDWDDEHAEIILRNILQAMSPSSRLIVIEGAVGDTGDQSLSRKLSAYSDLSMLVMLGGARERTESEFRALFARAGFRLVAMRKTKTPLKLMVLEG